MKVFFCLLILLAVTRTQAHEISIGVYHMPPHMHVENDQVHGAAVDFLTKYVFTQETWTPHWKAYQFSRLAKDLEYGKVDMAILVAKTPEREKLYQYSALPLLTTQSVIVVKKDFKTDHLKDLKPLRGLNLGHDLGGIVPAYFKGSGVKFSFLSGRDYFKRSLQVLRAGRVDGIFVPTASQGNYEIQNSSEFTILKIPNSELDFYVVFRHGLNQDFIDYMNKTLDLQKSQYPKLLKRWYSRDIYVSKGITFNN